MKGLILVLVAIAGILVIGFVLIFLHFLGVWIRALMSGAKVSLGSLIGMKLRRIPPTLIVDARIRIIKAGLRPRVRREGLPAFRRLTTMNLGPTFSDVSGAPVSAWPTLLLASRSHRFSPVTASTIMPGPSLKASSNCSPLASNATI